jgi:tetratricopeptide (TPR) repeat protein
MSGNESKKRPRVFISHSSANLDVAQQVETALTAAGFNCWLDHSNIRVGVLLGKELRQAIAGSRAVVLLWSKEAAASDWVATEILTAFHSGRFIIPCVISPPDLPQFLARSVHLNLQEKAGDALAALGRQVEQAPRRRNEFPALSVYQDQELTAAIQRIWRQQSAELEQVGRDLEAAQELHDKLDPDMHAAEQRWRYDPTILSLAGYHRKNGYMLKHWDEYNAGRFPDDPLLGEGRKFFLETLFVNPVDFSALNGLGNILFFQGELDAAEFFVEKAVECSAKAGVDYNEAKSDLELIRSRTVGSHHNRSGKSA